MLALANKLSLTTQPIYKFVNKYSIDFDGVDDRIITDGADTVAQPTTYSMWIKSSTTTENFGVFGHGANARGAFHLNSNDLYPMLYLGANYWIKWNDNSAQDDGEWHHYVVYLATNLTDSKLYIDGVLQTKNTTLSSGSLSAYTESLIIGSDRQVGGNSFEGKIDEFAVYDRELTQAEITRMYNTYYSPNRVANGNFSQIGNEEVTNGDFSQIGSELVTNGDFASATGWAISGGATISDGKAYIVGDGSAFTNISQSGVFTSGKQYKVTVDVTINSGLGLKFQDGANNENIGFATTSGSYTFYFASTSNTTLVIGRRTGGTAFDSSVDNVSVKEVGQGWSVSNSGSASSIITDSYAQLQTSGDLTSLEQTNVTTASKQYKLQYDVLETDGGNLGIVVEGNTVKTIPSSLGSHTEYFAAHSTTLVLKRSSGALDVKLDNISVKEVGQHWTFGTGWSTDGTKAIYDDSATNSITQNISFSSGKSYKIQFKVSNSSGSGGRMLFSNSATSVVYADYAYYTDGEYTLNYNATSNTTNFSIKGHTDGSSFDIDNIVVQELKHDATNLMLNAGDYQSANPLITSTKSMEFDGTDDYLNISDPTTTDLDFTDGIISCSAWVYLTSNSYGTVLNKGGSYYWYIGTAPTGVSQRVFLGNSGQKNSTTALTINKWHHIAFTSDNSNIKFYLDGKLDNTVSASYTISANTDDLRLGRSGSGEYLEGNLTEVGMYNRTLTDLEVASLYNQGVPTDLLVSRGDYVATGLQGYWKMGDGTNDEYPVIYDQVNPTLGSELVTNGDFATDLSGWTNGNNHWQWTSQGAYFPETTTHNPLSQTLSNGANDIFKFTFTLNIVKGTANVYYKDASDTTVSAQYTTSGTYTIYTVPVKANTNINFSRYGGINTEFYLDNVSVKEVQGNPATMTNMVEGNITNQYPLTKIRNYYRMGDGILDGYPIIQDQTSPNIAHIPTTNLITSSESFVTGWGYTDVTSSSASSITDPFGNNNAIKLIESATTAFHFASFGLTLGSESHTVSCYIKAAERTTASMFLSQSGNVGAIYDLSSGTVTSVTGTGNTASIENVGNGWFRCKLNNAGGADLNDSIRIGIQNGALDSYAGDGSSGIYVFGSQLEQQSQATAYLKSDGIAAVRKATTTNLIPYSEDFSAYTVSGNLTFGNNVTSPIGTTNASTINLTSASTFIYENVNVTQSTVYTFSFYVKKGTLNDINFKLAIYDDSNNSFISIDIPYSTSTDWTRVEHTFTTPSGCTDIRAYIFRNTSSQEGDFYVWGTQVEQQTQAETYAKTTGLPVTIDLFTENNYGTMTNMSASDIVEDTP